MKSILVYATEDEGQPARVAAALDLARATGAHLTFLHVTPYSAYVATDPFGGAYLAAGILQELARMTAEAKARLTERMRGQDVPWSWVEADGAASRTIVEHSHLADLILLSRPGPDGGHARDALSLVGDVLVHARAPVLAVPTSARGLDCFGPIAAAWNGSPEASHALQAALPLLKLASAVHLITIAEGAPPANRLPATDASEYLGYHGLSSELHAVPAGDDGIAATIGATAAARGAEILVMGGYGHSRFREAMLGGATRELLKSPGGALLLGH